MSTQVDVCVVGGGPAGMVAALQLVRAGAKVLVLERHKDFAREFRGEVLMPHFTQIAQQIGLEPVIERASHLKMYGAKLFFDQKVAARINFSKVCPAVPYAMWMPQEILLGCLLEECQKYPNFEIRFDAKVDALRKDGERVCGVEASVNGVASTIDAQVTIGADGRFSTVRRDSGFELEYEHYTFDVIWFQTERPKNYDPYVEFQLSNSFVYLIAPKHPDLLQVGILAKKGGISELRKMGVERLRETLLTLHPAVHDFARSLKDLTPFVPLQAKIEMVKRWAQNGTVLIGDAAHTCSPIGAIGVSIAVGSAVVAADVIQSCLERGDCSADALDKIQQLRDADVRRVHRVQRRAEILVHRPQIRRYLPYLASIGSSLGLLERGVGSFLARKHLLPLQH